jgi:hypothetical protein
MTLLRVTGPFVVYHSKFVEIYYCNVTPLN